MRKLKYLLGTVKMDESAPEWFGYALRVQVDDNPYVVVIDEAVPCPSAIGTSRILKDMLCLDLPPIRVFEKSEDKVKIGEIVYRIVEEEIPDYRVKLKSEKLEIFQVKKFALCISDSEPLDTPVELDSAYYAVYTLNGREEDRTSVYSSLDSLLADIKCKDGWADWAAEIKPNLVFDSLHDSKLYAGGRRKSEVWEWMREKVLFL